MKDSKESKENTLISTGEKNLDRVQEWTKVADQKAMFLLTVFLAILGLSFSVVDNSIQTIAKSIGCKSMFWLSIILIGLPFMIFIITALVGIWNLLNVVKPQTQISTGRNSPFHFTSIATMNLEKFKGTMKDLKGKGIIDELADQTYVVANIALNKFDILDGVLNKLRIAILTCLVFLLSTIILSNLNF